MRTRHGSATVILLAPACLLFALFVIYPLARGIALSFYDWNDVDAKVWVGLGNYRELAADPVFRTALANNLRWLACYAVAPALGLALAVLLSQRLRGMRVVRSLFFMAFVLSQVIVGLVFGWFFHSRFGLLNEILGAIGGPHVAPLDNERWALYTMSSRASGRRPRIA